MSIKIFVGNLSGDTESDDIRTLFEQYGTVEECDVLKNYGFVHMPDKMEAETAIRNLNGYNVKGQRMRVELSTGKGGNPKGDRRGSARDGRPPRSRPYPPGPPRRPPPRDYDPYDPYYRDPYAERDPYYRLPPVDRYLPRLPPVDDRYPPLPRDRLLPEERAAYLPPDPRDRFLARERLPPYPEDHLAYDRLRAAERAPPADSYYRERSPPGTRPPPEYYDRKSAIMRSSVAAAPSSAPSRLSTTAYPPANGYDYYRRPTDVPDSRPSYGMAGSGQDYKNGPAGPNPVRGNSGYDVSVPQRSAPPMQQQQQHHHHPPTRAGGAGGYGMPPPQQQQSSQKRHDSQSALQTRPIFF